MNQPVLFHFNRKLHPMTVVAMSMSSSWVHRSHFSSLVASSEKLQFAHALWQWQAISPEQFWSFHSSETLGNFYKASPYSYQNWPTSIDQNWPTPLSNLCANGRMHVSGVAIPSSKRCKYSLCTDHSFTLYIFFLKLKPGCCSFVPTTSELHRAYLATSHILLF